MLRTYIMPGFYILNRHRHGSSDSGRVWATIQNLRGGWWVRVHQGGEWVVTLKLDTLAEAEQIALLELHR